MKEAKPSESLRLPLYGVIAAVTLAFAIAINGRLNKLNSPPAAESPETAARDLRFDDLPDGNIGIYDASTGQLVELMKPGADNFIRGIVRALVRERRKNNLGPTIPFRLSSHSDGHLLLTDPATGQVIDLGSFGTDNIGSFARLLPPAAAVSEPAPAQPEAAAEVLIPSRSVTKLAAVHDAHRRSSSLVGFSNWAA